MSQAVMRRRKVNMKASMWLPISAGVVGELAMAATEPTESERPKIRSASVSILARGRFSAASRCNPSCERRSVFGLLAGCESGLGSVLLHGRPSVATCYAKVPKSIRRPSRQRGEFGSAREELLLRPIAESSLQLRAYGKKAGGVGPLHALRALRGRNDVDGSSCRWNASGPEAEVCRRD